MLDVLDADAVHRWCVETLAAAVEHQGEIDALNVYPVPDRDTGTNLVLTLRGALHEAQAAVSSGADGAAAVDAVARGALLAAKGNSGVLLSQLLRGLADVARTASVVGGAELALGLRAGSDAAYAAVAEPAEGTMLSVAREAAEAACRAAGGRRPALKEVARAAAGAAAVALGRTPEQLPALARAGVVDAGGRGLVLLFEALVGVVTGAPAHFAPLPLVGREGRVLLAARESGSAEYGYEVQYLLEADPPAVARLRGELASLGDSLAVVGTGDRLWNVHVHVNDAGAALEAGVAAGRPFRVTVARFADDGTGGQPPGRGAVAVCAGEGLAGLFRAEGAIVVAASEPGAPSADDLLDGIRRTGTADVVLLPNGSGTALAERSAEAARREGHNVVVVPTRSPVQGLAALSVRDPQRRFADDVILMAEAAGATRCGELVVAARDALTSAGTCRAGDVLGLAEGDVVVIGEAATHVGTALLDRLLGAGGELVTIVLGAGAGALGSALHSHVRDRWPMVEAVLYDGGQSDCLALVGVE